MFSSGMCALIADEVFQRHDLVLWTGKEDTGVESRTVICMNER